MTYLSIMLLKSKTPAINLAAYLWRTKKYWFNSNFKQLSHQYSVIKSFYH